MDNLVVETLEKWVLNHPEETQIEPYLHFGGKVYTMVDLSNEVKNNTEIGRQFIQRVIYLTIDLLSRQKQTL